MSTEIQESQRPEPHVFHIQIDRIHYEVNKKVLSGLELRQLPKPPIGPDRDLFMVVPGSADKKIENEELVEMHDGERFFTAPTHITPGNWVA